MHHRPLHRHARAPSIPDANFTSPYVVHHLDVCTVTALNDKQAFSDSIANRGRELSRGPNIATAPSPPMPSTQEWHHAPREGPARSRPSLSNPLCLASPLVPRNGRNYRTGHASFGSAAQPPTRHHALPNTQPSDTALANAQPYCERVDASRFCCGTRCSRS